MAKEQRLELTARRRSNGDVITRTTRFADPDDIGLMQQNLRDILAADGWDEGRFPEFDLEVRATVGQELLHTVTTAGLVRR